MCPHLLSPSASPAPGVSHLPSSPARTGGRGPCQPPGSRAPEGSRRAPGGNKQVSVSEGHLQAWGPAAARSRWGHWERSGPPSEVPSRLGFTLHPETSPVSRTPPPPFARRGARRVPPTSPADASTQQPGAPSQAPGLPWGVSGTPPHQQPGHGPRSLPHRRPPPATQEQTPQVPLQVSPVLRLGVGAAGSARGRLRK